LRCIALHFVKERAAYSISNFSDFKFNTAIYNKDLKYASIFQIFFFGELQRVVVHLHCVTLYCVASAFALHCSNATSNLHLLAALHCRL